MLDSSAVHIYTYPLGTLPGGQDTVSMNYLQNPFTAMAMVNVLSGTASYGIEFTVDDASGNPSLPSWFSLPSAPPGQTASAAYTITDSNGAPLPVTAIRLNLAANSGSVRFTVIQSPASL
jgi:hypothetical protein